MTEAAGLDAPITAVTVFRDGARITRSGQVTLSPGLSPVLMAFNLPVSADPESVRVAVRGAGCRLARSRGESQLWGQPAARTEIVRAARFGCRELARRGRGAR